MQLAGHQVHLSNLDKVLWPQAGLTKRDLIDYHARLHCLTVPHWRGRALTVVRYPHGVEGQFFYQKNIPAGAPKWVDTYLRKETEYVVGSDLSTIIWLANSNAVEFHPSTYLASNPEVPSYAVIDLDPTEPRGFLEAVQVGKRCREILEDLNLDGYPKLSGGAGLHIYIPLQASYNFQITSELVRYIALVLKRNHPGEVTLERLIKNRQGVYVDYLQNHPEKTMAGVYSPRPTPTATVSTAVAWEDLDYYQPRDFTIKTVPRWVEEKGDLFQPVLYQQQSLEHLQMVLDKN